MSDRPSRKRSRRKGHAAPPTTLTVDVTGRAQGVHAELRRAVARTLSGEDRRLGHVDVAVVDEPTMRRLHARWMDDPSLTDVLTFNLSDGSEDKKRGRRPIRLVDAQLVVCDAVARRRARERKGTWQGELVLYVVHGCLHLCGYDDRRPADAQRMHRHEDAILTQLGYGPVYYAPSTNRTPQRRKRNASASRGAGDAPVGVRAKSRRGTGAKARGPSDTAEPNRRRRNADGAARVGSPYRSGRGDGSRARRRKKK